MWPSGLYGIMCHACMLCIYGFLPVCYLQQFSDNGRESRREGVCHRHVALGIGIGGILVEHLDEAIQRLWGALELTYGFD